MSQNWETSAKTVTAVSIIGRYSRLRLLLPKSGQHKLWCTDAAYR